MNQHDHSYKLLFSHPEMVQDLLTGFVHEEWVNQLDFSTLEKVNGSYITDELREREDDIIWRVRWGERWLYVYLLLEFQSTVDKYMAVRVMSYLGLLYQDIIRQKALTPSGQLPPVLPIVLYNGESRWNAAQDVKELIERIPGGLSEYAPQLRYLLLDEGAILASPDWQEETRNLVAGLFRLEHNRDEQDMLNVLGHLVEWLKAAEQSQLRRAFVVWIRRVLLPNRQLGSELLELNDVQDLDEVHDMLSERINKWPERWIEKGREEGMEKGMEKGLHQGVEATLRKQITLKFGAVPEWANERITSATTEQLDTWVVGILSAETLEQLLA